MKLADHPHLDAVAGEYLLGTLRGPARKRFERSLRDEPRVALHLRRLEALFTPRYAPMMEVQPAAHTWARLERELDLARYRTPWYRRLGIWRGLAAASTAALVLSVGFQLMRPSPSEPAMVVVARLEGKSEAARVTAALALDRTAIELKTSRPVLAGPQQSYELWLLPQDGGAPLSLAVLGTLDARFPLAEGHRSRVRAGAKFAVTVEPAGGSPRGVATGPVILVGEISL